MLHKRHKKKLIFIENKTELVCLFLTATLNSPGCRQKKCFRKLFLFFSVSRCCFSFSYAQTNWNLSRRKWVSTIYVFTRKKKGL